MQSIKQILDYMNDIAFPYVVLRNWENLPDKVELGIHSDLDLLVYDFDHWTEIFPEAERTYPHPRVQFRVPVRDSFVYVDVRSVGDDYYPEHFQKAILGTREYNPKGFFTPNPLHHRLALAYHVVHHKNGNTYKKWLGDVSVDDLFQALKDSNIGWIKPQDPTVGSYNPYWKGATSTVTRDGEKVIKKQTGWGTFNLTANEHRVLSKCKSKHFPKVLSIKDGEIEIEDCGEILTTENLPKDWKKQFKSIVKDLEKNAVVHRDIKPDNLLVKNGVVKLIDFGWSRFKDDEPDNPPNCLGYPYKPSYGFDDNYSLRKVMKELDFQLCESLE